MYMNGSRKRTGNVNRRIIGGGPSGGGPGIQNGFPPDTGLPVESMFFG